MRAAAVIARRYGRRVNGWRVAAAPGRDRRGLPRRLRRRDDRPDRQPPARPPCERRRWTSPPGEPSAPARRRPAGTPGSGRPGPPRRRGSCASSTATRSSSGSAAATSASAISGWTRPRRSNRTRPSSGWAPRRAGRTPPSSRGRTCVLEKDVSETDRYGRLLRYVWLYDGARWTLVDLELVAEGFAQVETDPPDVKYAGRFVAAERAARAAGLGLWGPGRRAHLSPGRPTAGAPTGASGPGRRMIGSMTFVASPRSARSWRDPVPPARGRLPPGRPRCGLRRGVRARRRVRPCDEPGRP